MDKHPTCVITVLIVDQLGPNTLCAIPWLSIYFTVCSCLLKEFCLSFFFFLKMCFSFFVVWLKLFCPHPPTHSLHVLLSCACVCVCVYKVNVEAYELQAIELIMRSRVLQAALCSSFKTKAWFSSDSHPSASFRVRVCPAGVNVLARGRYFVVNVHFRTCECVMGVFFPPGVWLFFFSAFLFL